MTPTIRWTGLLLCALAVVAAGQVGAAPAEYRAPLGIALEEVPYPHPVDFVLLEIERQSVRMAYMDVRPEGRPDAPVVVLLHGKNFWGAYWRDTIATLVAAGYRAVVPDQVGFGKSAKPEIHYSFDLLARNTVALLDHLGIKRFAVVGHSMGGMLAVRLARAWPGRVTRLVLENPIGLEDYRLKVPPVPTDWFERNDMSRTTEAIRSAFQRYVVRWDEAIYEHYVEIHARVRLSGEYPRWARASALTAQMIYQQPVRHEFPLIVVPTLLVIGLEDRTALGRGLVSPEAEATLGRYTELGRAAAKDIPGSRLVELPSVGHIPHLESPDQFHVALLDFLKE
jgi:pimeloyl-ACP methyl ester carboxylesterase